jgi:hypothetical protein
MEADMVLTILETAVMLLGLGALIGLCRRVGPRDVMLLIGDALLPFGGHAWPERKR